ncbi:hypothetical protein BDN70DRAFT_909381 [Pholiota conissans]|uniref:CxC2-like cysteine cluster KDZ transposase-associated domain-containing protein n=1 Tax=Pholiota conissans TaxID=109636 RepID=A0A9P6CSR4_9AGAR|nr:hypothetical protein BDN70DRAFT_909381 [Pholiota conissans]
MPWLALKIDHSNALVSPMEVLFTTQCRLSTPPTIASSMRRKNTTSWSPPDDLQFALDPNGEKYDAVLEGEVMDDLQTELAIAPRKKKSTVSKWTGAAFQEISLRSLGLVIQLNHSSMHCDNPVPSHASFVILHTNGIHSVAVQYCGCTRAIPHHIQLLRRRLYPASQVSVKTCATFDLLRLLHKMSLSTKASTYDFYRCLEKLTTNTGIDTPKSRYRALFRMILQWRHLQMLKWAGVAHQDGGISSIQPGQLAVRCPSCPHPGINLVSGWNHVPDELKFLFTMIICMDANFRLKNQLVSNYSQDPGLGIGWAYMVPRKPYEEYVLSRASEEDISTCVGLQALAKADTKYNAGLRYTGCNITVCGRSEMILPLGVGNLQKGERYCNMDYIFGSTLQFVLVQVVLISYDIACQWFINLFKRIDEHWPNHIKPRPDMTFIPAIPKLHEPMHKAAGHEVFSLNFIRGCGFTDCECVERVWAPHNALANATKTQGPGSRQDVLDDHFGFWNWEKYISMGSTLLRRYKAAVKERNLQVEGHRGLTESLDRPLVNKWEKICAEWDMDTFPKSKQNPYQLDGTGMSFHRMDLADEEAKYLARGGTFLHATSASMFINMGLDLEETHELLPIYIPGLLQHHTDHPPPQPKSSNSEDMLLWLPSRISQPHRSRICTAGLAVIEERLRDAQLPDALENIRKILKIKSRLIQFKNKNIRGQRDGTRSRAVIDRVHDRARYSAEKYRDARAAKYALAGPGKWEEIFHVLEDSDIRGYQDPNRLRQRVGRRGVLEDDQKDRAKEVPMGDKEFTLFNEERKRRDGTGETRRTLSWIWLTTTASSAEDDKDDILRSEWARSRARAARGKEEVMLLKEEMRRVLAFLAWKADWWRQRGRIKDNIARDAAEGLRAFAQVQAALQDALAAHFRGLWRAPLEETTPRSGHIPSVQNPNVNRDGSDDDDEADDDDDDDDSGGDDYDGDDGHYEGLEVSETQHA